jgi:hypothetical protein
VLVSCALIMYYNITNFYWRVYRYVVSTQAMVIYSDINEEIISLYIWLDVFCLFEAKSPDFDSVFISIVVPVFQGEKLHVLFARLLTHLVGN